MATTINDIAAAQRASWNKFSAGWRKWDAITMDFLAPAGEAIMDHLGATGSSKVLDVAAGTGEPGLSIARHLHGGKVVITDLADHMLEVARDKAAEAGITNVEFCEADASNLPFADHTFDEVSCRMGFMFFPDMERAAREMARVLKPGGRVAATVWAGPEKNFWVTCMTQQIGRHIDLPTVDPQAPGMFRCAHPGLMTELFRQAGFSAVEERELPCVLGVSGPQEYWDMMTEVAAPFVAALGSADQGTVERIRSGVLAAIADRFPKGHIDAYAIVVTAVR